MLIIIGYEGFLVNCFYTMLYYPIEFALKLALEFAQKNGPVAQLVERRIRIAEIRGSIPLRSTCLNHLIFC